MQTSSTLRASTSGAPSGFTLIELVVVLTILAVLAAAATVSTAGVVDQSRYDTTRSRLTDIESAVIGRPGLLDSQNRPWIQGFVADVGRVPKLIGTPGVDDGTLLNELWIAPVGVAPFSIQSAPGDPDVQLPCGWRGPYLRLPLGSTQVLDGWGHALHFVAEDGTPAVGAQALAGVTTLGADAQVGGAGYDADYGIVLSSTVAPLVAARHSGDVPFQVTGKVPDTAPTDVYVVVRLYGALDGSLITYDQPILGDTAPTALPAGTDIDFIGSFENVPIGPRALRVYLLNTDLTGIDKETAFTSAQIVAQSAIQHLTVVAGGIPTVVVSFD